MATPAVTRNSSLRLLLVVALGVCAGYLAAEVVRVGPALGFPLDDSWIHLQFARNLASGDGLSYQLGEKVTGSTAPLWTALLSLVFLLPGGPVLWGKALGVAFYLGSVQAVYVLGRELDLGHRLALVAAGFFLLTDWMLWSAMSGMEITFFAWLTLWGMILHIRERLDPSRLPLALPVLAVATLVRPEGLLLLLVAVTDRLVMVEQSDEKLRFVAPRWKPLLRGIGLVLVVLVPATLVYRSIGGSWLPTTFAVKTEGVRHLLPSGRDLYRVAGILFRPQPFLFLSAGAGVLSLLERWGTSRDRGLVPALWLLGLPLAYSTFSSPGRALLVGNFGRYFFPLFPAMIVLGVVGLQATALHLRKPLLFFRRPLPIGALLLLLLFAPSIATTWNGAWRYAQNVQNVQDSDVRMAHWIGQHLPPQAILAVQDIGALKYFGAHRIVDLAGIVNPEILPYIKGPRVGSHPSRLGGMMQFLQERGADFLVVYPDSYPGLAAFPELRAVHRLPVPGNITMAGDELVVFLTPWSRFRPLATSPNPRPDP